MGHRARGQLVQNAGQRCANLLQVHRFDFSYPRLDLEAQGRNLLAGHGRSLLVALVDPILIPSGAETRRQRRRAVDMWITTASASWHVSPGVCGYASSIGACASLLLLQKPVAVDRPVAARV